MRRAGWRAAAVLFLGFGLIFAFTSAGAAGAVVGPEERSTGDPKVFRILRQQGIEPAVVLERGTTLTKLCDIGSGGRPPKYSIYWLEHLTQAAIEVHGRAEIIAISSVGHVLGQYDSEISEQPHCVGHNKMARVVDVADGKTARHVTTFYPSRLPHWLGGGSGFFSRADRYASTSRVDGVELPPEFNPQ